MNIDSNITTEKYNEINKKYKGEYEFAQFIPVPGMFNSSIRGCVAKSSSMNFNKMSGLHTYQSCQTKAGLMYSNILNNERKDSFNKKKRFNKMLGLYFEIVEGLYNGDPTYFAKSKIITSGVINNFNELGSITKNINGPVSVEVSGFIESSTNRSIKLEITSSNRFQMWINKNSVYDYTTQNAFVNINSRGKQSKSIEMFAGVGRQIRVQYQVNNSLSSNISIVDPISYYYYTTNDNKNAVNPNQMYFYLEENSKEDTKNGLFNCYINDANKIGTNALETNKYPVFEVYPIWSVIDKIKENNLLLPDNYAMIDDNGNFSIYNGSSIVKNIFINKKYDCNMQLNDDEARQYQSKNKIKDYTGAYTNSILSLQPLQPLNLQNMNIGNESIVEEFKEGFFGLFKRKKKSQSQPQIQPQPQSQVLPESQSQVLPESQPQIQPQSQPQVLAESQPQIITNTPSVKPTTNTILLLPKQPISEPPSRKKYSSFSDYINSFWTTEGCKKGESPIQSYRINMDSNNNKISIYIEQTTSNGNWIPISLLYSKNIANEISN